MQLTTWRNLYSFIPGTEKPDDDPDGDGLPNFVEYALDTDPLKPNSKQEFQVLNVQEGSASFSLSRPKFATGIEYRILSGEELNNLDNRSVQLFDDPENPERAIINVTDPVQSSHFYQINIQRSE